MSTRIETIYNTATLEIRNDGADVELNSSKQLEGNLFNKRALIAALEAEGVLEDDLPTDVTYEPQYLCYKADGVMVRGDDAEDVRKRGLAHLAVANYMDEQGALADKLKQEAEARAIRLRARRDDLTNQLINPETWQRTDWKYERTTPVVKRAVDCIIDLEDASK